MPPRVKINSAEDTEVYMVQFQGSQRALARASDGRWWATYRSVTQRVYAAYSDDNGLSWTEEMVSADAVQGAQGTQMIMVDSQDIPHVIWHYNRSTEVITYNSRAGGSWGTQEAARTSGGTLDYVSACIDSSNTFHIIYEESADINYVTGTQGSWSAPETVDATGLGPTDVTVDSNDVPFTVFWSNPVQSSFHLRHRTGGAWQAAEQIGSVDQTVGTVSVAMDSSDDIHVVWSGDGYSPETGNLQARYRKRTSGVWGTDIQVAHTGTGTNDDILGPLLLLDTDGIPQVFYQGDGTDEGVYYRSIIGGVAGDTFTLDADVLRPGNYSGVYAGIWQLNPSSNIVSGSILPIALINDEVTGTTAALYFYAPNLVGSTVGAYIVSGVGLGGGTLPMQNVVFSTQRNPKQLPFPGGAGPQIVDLEDYRRTIRVSGIIPDTFDSSHPELGISKNQLEDIITDDWNSTQSLNIFGDVYVGKPQRLELNYSAGREEQWEYSLVWESEGRS